MRIEGRYQTKVEADSVKEAEEAAFSEGDFDDLHDIDGELVSADPAGDGPESDPLENYWY